jgi:hypothetical protein
LSTNEVAVSHKFFDFSKNPAASLDRTPAAKGEQFGKKFGTLRSSSGLLVPIRSHLGTHGCCGDAQKVLFHQRFHIVAASDRNRNTKCKA